MPAKRSGSASSGSQATEGGSERLLVVIAEPDADLRARATRVESAAGTDTAKLNRVLDRLEGHMRPLFGESEERLKAKVAAASGMGQEPAPDLHLYYTVEAPADKLDELAQELAAMPGIAGAYVTPEPVPATAISPDVVREAPRQVTIKDLAHLNDMMPASVEAPPATADMTSRQMYLDAAPAGIDARYAWTVPGGRGWNVQVIDVEGAWRFTHEDLLVNQGGVIRTQTTDLGWRNHGTAVVGVIGGDVNSIGITGIAPDAHTRGCSIFDVGGLAGALVAAADHLRPGDIILIEVQYTHPTRGFTSVEWWPAEHAAIRYAVNRGITVVEAAGNGNNNLDDPTYNTPLAGFPATWRNPFNLSNLSSGAVVVGAGNPPSGIHGRTQEPRFGEVYYDRARCFFSNYGSRVDCQGYGWEVTTAGYGDLQGGSSEDLWYTDLFSGTSSASPTVVGALACVQGILRAAGRIPLSPARARQLVRQSGSPQQDAPGRPRTQRIGNRPNLRQLVALATPQRQWIGVQFTGIVPANSTVRWFTFNWPAHWHVLWTVMPTSPKLGAPQISSSVSIERASDAHVTYWISVTNHTAEPVNIEGRYAVLGW
ncbi:MAG TPA: S8 family serine peptidase [Candidatus Limnocylindria bacterium]|nr:S8 family serine peptidase [Candidatus Limnocylindria bacterium]